MTEQLIEGQIPVEIVKHASPLVVTCIDFRAVIPKERWLRKFQLSDGSYFLYASAGASGNPDRFLEIVKPSHHPAILVGDHEDCGYYKNNGNDSPEHHDHNLQLLGQKLHRQNPAINYIYNLLPINDNRHQALATAIILGQPRIVEAAKEILDGLNLANNYDVIARPYQLSTTDNTLWNDLGISLLLHQPPLIFVFDNNQENAQRLVTDAKLIAPDIDVVPVVIK